MNEQFKKDLEIGKEAEQIVFNVFSALDPDHKFEMVGGCRDCFYLGDILALDKDGRRIYIEVKNDSRIAETGNILCEEEVYYKRHDYYGKGNMQSNGDIYAVVSQQQRKIYVCDYECLRRNYRKGVYKVIDHPTQTTYCYLLELCLLKKFGGLISVVNY